MEVGKKNLFNGNGDKVICTFDVSGEENDMSSVCSIGEVEQGKFSFTDGFEENLEGNQIEEIEILKDIETDDCNNEKSVTMMEDKESLFLSDFKEYIKICSEMNLIPSWSDLKKFSQLKNKHL